MFGDSKMVIEWATGRIQINAPAPHLQHLLKTIKEQIGSFEMIFFKHIYREQNIEADKQSILALALPPGLTEVEEKSNDQTKKPICSFVS